MPVETPITNLPPYLQQQERWLNPHLHINEDIATVYNCSEQDLVIGWPKGVQRIFEALARDNTAIIVGAEFGDEGKGRVGDNKLQALTAISGVEIVYMSRFQGGNNSGHTLQKDDERFALHQVPSFPLHIDSPHAEVVGIMDTGMTIHPEDLMTEVGYVENIVGDTREKLILSENAILCTDLERAEEVLNRVHRGRSRGGTGRGISPSYAHHYDRLGLKIHDLIADDWRETLSKQYDQYERYLLAFDLELQDIFVPDFKATKETHSAQERVVGTKEEFLDRLEATRTWLVERGMVQNTFRIHEDIYQNLSKGILFEGAQAMGLHPWLGTRPDVTSSDTSAYGVQTSTGLWRVQDIADRIGVFKITYSSSVGARHMATEVTLPQDLTDLPVNASEQEFWAANVREKAHEYGTTTGRPRDILHLDLPLLMFNARMGGIEVLAGTHLDIAREGEDILVCTHYEDSKGNPLPYQPGLQYQKGVKPHYVALPGWRSEEAQQARTFDELPENAKRFVAFVQRRTGIPIVVATTGPDQADIVPFNGWDYRLPQAT